MLNSMAYKMENNHIIVDLTGMTIINRCYIPLFLNFENSPYGIITTHIKVDLTGMKII